MKNLDFDRMFDQKPEDIHFTLFGKEYTLALDMDFVKALKSERILKEVAQIDTNGDPDTVGPTITRLMKELAVVLFDEATVAFWYENGLTDTQLFAIMTTLSEAMNEVRAEHQDKANPTKAQRRKKATL